MLTLYDASGAATFAGDARLGGLPTGENRLLSFAQDLRTTVERTSTEQTTLASLTAAQGVLHVTMRQREVLRITLTAPANESRRVLVEIPRRATSTLTLEGGPVPGTEETATAWRVPVSLKPGEIRTFTAYIDRLEREDTVLLANDAAVVVRLLNEQTLTPAARAALQHLAALRQDAAAKRAALDQLKAQQAAVLQDEDRIRRNLGAVAPNDALHARLTRRWMLTKRSWSSSVRQSSRRQPRSTRRIRRSQTPRDRCDCEAATLGHLVERSVGGGGGRLLTLK